MISDLVHAAKQEDQRAFRHLLDIHWNELYGFMIKRTENENDAEDLCLQAFSKAFDKIETYDNKFTFSTIDVHALYPFLSLRVKIDPTPLG